MVQKHLQAKIKNHYVWSDYLKRWSENHRDVYYTTKTGEIAFDSVKGIAMEKHFYRVKKLDDLQVHLIKSLSRICAEPTRKYHMLCLNRFLARQNQVEALDSAGRNISENAERQRNALESNGLEDLHTSNENEVKDIMVALANRDLSILDDEKNMINFCLYLGHQISRTKQFKESTLAQAAEVIGRENPAIGKALDECSWFLSYMFGMNIGVALYNFRHIDKHCMLLNDTGVPFVTSDQPIVNVFKSLSENKVTQPSDDECDFYYPISPTVGYMINRSDDYNKGFNTIARKSVENLNVKLARNARMYIISNSRESLLPLVKNRGFRSDLVKSTFEI